MGQNAGNGKAPEKVLILYKYETNTLKIRVRIINPSDFLILIRITMPRALSRRRLALRPVMPSAARGLRPLHPRKATAWARVQTRRPARLRAHTQSLSTAPHSGLSHRRELPGLTVGWRAEPALGGRAPGPLFPAEGGGCWAAGRAGPGSPSRPERVVSTQ